MKKINVNNLEGGLAFPGKLYHASGNLILEKGKELREEELYALRKANIKTLYMVESNLEKKKIEQGRNYVTIPVQDLEEGTRTGRPIYDMSNVLLLQEEKEITRGLKDRLFNRGIEHVKVMKTAEERAETERKFKKYMESLNEISPEESSEADANHEEETDDDFINELLGEIEADQEENEKRMSGRLEKDNYGSGPNKINRRRHPRYHLDVGVTFLVLEKSGDGTNPRNLHRGTIENISRSGVCLVTDEKLQTGDKIRIRLKIPGGRKIDGALRIVRKRSRGQGIFEFGAQFLNVNRSILSGPGQEASTKG